MSISILIGTYGTLESPGNQSYLDLCLKSLEAQTFKDFDVNIVSSGSYRPEINSTLSIRHFHSDEQTHFPKAVTMAYEMSHAKSKNILLLNDDTILSKTCLSEMYQCLEEYDVLLNPLSNCDNGLFYLRPIGIRDDTQQPFQLDRRQYTIGSMPRSNLPELVIENTIPTERTLIFPHMVAFYCTMMRRSAWSRLGGIDPEYKMGFDDLDMCARASKIGIRPTILTSAFCFHFSGISADKHITPQDREFNLNRFQAKFSSK